MNGSVRSYLMSGLGVVGACAIAIAPVQVPPPVDPVAADLTAAPVRSNAQVVFAAAVRRMTPADISAAISATAQPGTLSAASDFIVNAWNAAVPWINYGVDLADYVLGFIPLGYLIGDQISIVWYSFGLPVANSFVLDLVAPVVDEPLNLSTWVDGLAEVGSTTVTSLINLGISEFNYFFGWLIPPIPPLPLATAAEDAQDAMASAIEAPELVGDAGEETEGTSEQLGEDVTTHETVADEQDGADEEAAEEEPADEEVETTDSSGAVTAQGEVRGSELSASTETDVDQSDAHTPEADDQHDNPTDTLAQTPSSNDDGTGSEDTQGDTGEE